MTKLSRVRVVNYQAVKLGFGFLRDGIDGGGAGAFAPTPPLQALSSVAESPMYQCLPAEAR